VLWVVGGKKKCPRCSSLKPKEQREGLAAAGLLTSAGRGNSLWKRGKLHILDIRHNHWLGPQDG